LREQRISRIIITAPFSLGQFAQFEEHTYIVADMTESDKITGHYLQKRGQDAVFVFPDPADLEKYPEIDYGELHEAACRWFVDQHGFSTRSFKCSDATAKCEIAIKGPVVLVTFIDDGIVMAKLQGIIA
jgi:hypothetical protein